jgi:hypothetical protein
MFIFFKILMIDSSLSPSYLPALTIFVIRSINYYTFSYNILFLFNGFFFEISKDF